MQRLACFHRSAALLALLLLTSGCATIPEDAPLYAGLFPQTVDAANVYILRPYHDFGRAVSYNVLLNERRVADLPNGTYTMIQVPAGTYSINIPGSFWSGMKDIKGQITADIGRSYFLALVRQTKEQYGIAVIGTIAVPTHGTEIMWEGWVPYSEKEATRILGPLRFVKPDTPTLSR